MTRALSSKNIFSKRFKTFPFDELWGEVMGAPEDNGIWLIYGAEKHGKTTFAIMFANYLTRFGRVDYVSAEEGIGANFRDAILRAGLDEKSKVKWREYTPLEDIKEILKKRQSAKFILLDNCTIYKDEIKNGELQKLLKEFPNTVFIFLAHEEKNQPYTATAKVAKKLAKIIVRIEGLTAFISGRCPGGTLIINDKKSQLYHGHTAVK